MWWRSFACVFAMSIPFTNWLSTAWYHNSKSKSVCRNRGFNERKKKQQKQPIRNIVYAIYHVACCVSVFDTNIGMFDNQNCLHHLITTSTPVHSMIWRMFQMVVKQLVIFVSIFSIQFSKLDTMVHHLWEIKHTFSIDSIKLSINIESHFKNESNGVSNWLWFCFGYKQKI